MDDSAKGGLTQFWELFPSFLAHPKISNVDSSSSLGAKYFFEHLLHPFLRKLFLHFKEAILHLKWHDQFWTYQFMAVSEISAMKSLAKRAQVM